MGFWGMMAHQISTLLSENEQVREHGSTVSANAMPVSLDGVPFGTERVSNSMSRVMA